MADVPQPKPVEATSQRTIDQIVLLLGIALILAVGAVAWISISQDDLIAIKDVALVIIGIFAGAFTTDAIRRRLPSDPPEMFDAPAGVSFAPDPNYAVSPPSGPPLPDGAVPYPPGSI